MTKAHPWGSTLLSSHSTFALRSFLLRSATKPTLADGWNSAGYTQNVQVDHFLLRERPLRRSIVEPNVSGTIKHDRRGPRVGKIMDVRMRDPIKSKFNGGHRVHLVQQIFLYLPQDLVALLPVQGPTLQLNQTVQLSVGNMCRIASSLGVIILVKGRIDRI